MEEAEFLHALSVETNVNIELLKDLSHDEKFLALLRARKLMDAIAHLRSLTVASMGLREAKLIAEAFAARNL